MAKLTVNELKALTAGDDGRTLRDDGNLVGRVAARQKGVSVYCHYRFKWEGKYKHYACGTWSKQSLSLIRAVRDDAQAKLAKGINPSEKKKVEKIEAQAAVQATIAEAKRLATENLTVADLFDDWVENGVARQDGNAELRRSFNKDVLPIIGQTNLKELSEKDILVVLRTMRARGLNRAVVIRNNDLGQMLHWGEKRQPWRALMVAGNPIDLIDVEKLLDQDYEEERDRILPAEEIRELQWTFARLESDYSALPAGSKYSGIRPVNRRVQCAMWICLSTICRIGTP